MAHEKETLEAVIQAQTKHKAAYRQPQNPSDAGAIAGLAGAEGLLGGALRIFLPKASDLKANQNMANLKRSSTGNKVFFSSAFNDAVTAYNTYKQTFHQLFLRNVWT